MGTTAPTRAILRRGDTGPLVRAWQRLLVAKGFVRRYVVLGEADSSEE